MGWEKGRYYTRSTRVNGRVVRTYVGAGAAGAAAEAADLAVRSRRRELRRQLLDEQRRDELMSSSSTSIGELVRAAAGGEPGALALVERELERRPGIAAEIVPGALAAWINRRSGGDPVVRLVLMRQVEELRSGLVGPDSSSLEVLIADRILVAWLALEWTEVAYLQGLEREHTQSQALYWQKRVDAAQRRFLASCRGLAQVQRSDLGEVLQRIAAARASQS